MPRVKRCCRRAEEAPQGPRAGEGLLGPQEHPLPLREGAGRALARLRLPRPEGARSGTFRQLWITRINAAARANGLSYNQFVHGCRRPGSSSTGRCSRTSPSATRPRSARSPSRRRPRFRAPDLAGHSVCTAEYGPVVQTVRCVCRPRRAGVLLRRRSARRLRLITSRDNERLKLVRKLHDRRWRDKLGLFVGRGGGSARGRAHRGLEPVGRCSSRARMSSRSCSPRSRRSRIRRASIAVYRRDDLPRGGGR